MFIASLMNFFIFITYDVLLTLQWNPVITDTKVTCQKVCIIWVSVLSGFHDKKSQTHVLLMERPRQTFFTATKRFIRTLAVTSSVFCNCHCNCNGKQ